MERGDEGGGGLREVDRYSFLRGILEDRRRMRQRQVTGYDLAGSPEKITQCASGAKPCLGLSDGDSRSDDESRGTILVLKLQLRDELDRYLYGRDSVAEKLYKRKADRQHE